MFLLGFFLVQISAAAAAQACYYLSGNAAQTDTPCNATASSSACCNPDDYCLTNGLCFSSSTLALVRGSCTDPTWRAPECAKYCLSNTGAVWESIYPCADGKFCCGNSSCCNDSSGFSIPAAKVALRSPQVSQPTHSNASSASPASPANTKNLAIGLGVGIPLGLALIGTLFFLSYELRRYNNRKTEAPIQVDPSKQLDPVATDDNDLPEQQQPNLPTELVASQIYELSHPPRT